MYSLTVAQVVTVATATAAKGTDVAVAVIATAAKGTAAAVTVVMAVTVVIVTAVRREGRHSPSPTLCKRNDVGVPMCSATP